MKPEWRLANRRHSKSRMFDALQEHIREKVRESANRLFLYKGNGVMKVSWSKPPTHQTEEKE